MAWMQLLVSGTLIALAWAAKSLGYPLWIHNGAMVIAAFVSGVAIAKEAWARLRLRQFSIPLLVAIASIGALIIGEVWEAAAVTFLFRFGGYLEELTLSRTRAALRHLLDMRPLTARVLADDGAWVEVPAESVNVGQRVLIRPGEKAPVDGVVVEGAASVDTAALTGESLPKEIAVGDSALAGSVVLGGYLEVEAERVASDTTFNRLIRLVAQAQNEKPKAQRYLDRFAQVYTPLIIVVALILLIWSGDLHLALTFLVIGCPGALVVAAPVAIVAGLGRAARRGILIKGGERLEALGRLDTIAFDKTGTLTQGSPSASRVASFSGDEKSVLALAATAEARSEHHLARAILEKAEASGVEPFEARDWQFYPGRGVSADSEHGVILVGNRELMAERGVPLDERSRAVVAEMEGEGQAIAYVALNGELAGVIGLRDEIRPEAERLVAALRSLGIRETVMLTGDHAKAAARVSERLGIDRTLAGLLPEDKVSAIQALQKEGAVVAMVGDGVNDAPALATADASVAMGSKGTQVAMETADIVLVEDRLDRLAESIALARKIMAIVRQNVAIAVTTVLLLLVGVISRNVGLGLGMLIHEASILIVIANGMRLLKGPKRSAPQASVQGGLPRLPASRSGREPSAYSSAAGGRG